MSGSKLTMGIEQPKISALVNGRLSGFSIECLFIWIPDDAHAYWEEKKEVLERLLNEALLWKNT